MDRQGVRPRYVQITYTYIGDGRNGLRFLRLHLYTRQRNCCLIKLLWCRNRKFDVGNIICYGPVHLHVRGCVSSGLSAASRRSWAPAQGAVMPEPEVWCRKYNLLRTGALACPGLCVFGTLCCFEALLSTSQGADVLSRKNTENIKIGGFRIGEKLIA